MLITLSGLDGAGKSTLIELLKKSLEQRNKRVAVLHMDHQIGVYAYLQLIRRLIVSSPSGADGQPTKKGQCLDRPEPRKFGRLKAAISRGKYTVLWNKPLRRVIYLVDLAIFIFYRLYIETLKKQILIMDRYFYDRLVDVAGAQTGWSIIRVLALLTPTPTLPVYLDVSPEEAYARKREFSVDYLRRRQASYRRVFPLVRSSVVLASGEDIDATARRLEKLAIERTCA
jgi:thymidylate kinase